MQTGDEWWWRGYYFCGNHPDIVLVGELTIDDDSRGDVNWPIVGWVTTEILRTPYRDQGLRVGQALFGPVGVFGELDDGSEEIGALSVVN